MAKKYQVIFLIFILIVVIIFLKTILGGTSVAVLNPKGLIAKEELRLIITYILLMLIIAIPALMTLFLIAWKYRENNTKAQFLPEWTSSKRLQIFLWAVPSVFLLILGMITWWSTHQLDPYKPIESSVPPLNIQVVALQWKWLFIYPDQNIATVNFIQFPEHTPINFKLTADAPMSSFWIPQLGGQIYAMTGMSTQTHFIADTTGDFSGSDAEINGTGIAGMKFTARSSSQADFDSWVQTVKQSPTSLTFNEYTKLAKPSENSPVEFYSSTEQNLYNEIINKFMTPASQTPEIPNMKDMPGMEQK